MIASDSHEQDADCVAHISDLGMARKLMEEIMEGTTVETQLPIRWIAPESMERPAKYSCKTDVWSFGVCLWELFRYIMRTSELSWVLSFDDVIKVQVWTIPALQIYSSDYST